MLSLRPVANGKEGNKLGVTQLSKQGVANTYALHLTPEGQGSAM